MLNNLIKTTTSKRKTVGRGIGSGKGGHTVGRGQKGQKTRDKIPLTFEGTKIKKSLLKRLPVLSGKGKFKPLKTKWVEIKLLDLNKFKSEAHVNLETLLTAGLIKKGQEKVKIIAGGSVGGPLVIEVPVSHGARLSVEKAGGKVVVK